MTANSFRVYFVTHADHRLTGILMRSWSTFADRPLPSAYGATEQDVFDQLEVQMRAAEAAGTDHPSRYLWNEKFESRRITVDIFPQSVVEKRTVIGKKRVPLRLTYAFSRIETGGYRVMLPRFDWWFILEDLEVAPEVLQNAISTALLGENPKWIYDFRREGEEYVVEWSPGLLQRTDAVEALAEQEPECPTLEAVAEEWVERAAKGKLTPIAGTVPDLTANQLDLFTRDDPAPASILLVGGPGVGKTTWVKGLARLFLSKKRETKTAGGASRVKRRFPRIWATSRDRIIAGMIYLGMWQERCIKIVGELSHEGDYLYVDRLTSILQEQPDGASIMDIFAPALESGEISLIAECSEAELERCRRKHPRLIDRFHRVRLEESPKEAIYALLEQYRVKKGGRMTIHPQAMRRLVHHLDTFQKDTLFPGKAFRFFDWLAQESAPDRGMTIYPRDVSLVYSRYSGLPVELISDEHPATAAQIAGRLGARVIGQDEACMLSSEVLARFKSGLNDPQKPVGSLFFVGPTGVGKTELAKQLARYMFGSEDRMIRLDMSEYMTPGSADRLLDVGRGVTSLAERVRQTPLSLVLLDEIEKAHPEVFDLLLGILGEGRSSDALGRRIDFRMVLFVMTSNLGASGAAAVGFEGADRPDYRKSVREHFRPELFNRIDRVISFNRLARADIERIVDLIIDALSDRTGMKRRNLRLSVSPEARRRLAELGYHPERGARPLRRAIEERLIAPLAMRMAEEPELRDQEISIGLQQIEAAGITP